MRKEKLRIVPEDHEAWTIMAELIEEHHGHLENANIQLVWMLEPCKRKGKVILGKCMVVPELWHRLCELDVVIFLLLPQWEVWSKMEDQERGVALRRYLLDHELSHAAPKIGKDGEEEKDAVSGRTVYSSMPHDVTEFGAVLRRNGVLLSDMSEFLWAASGQIRNHLQQLEIERTPEAA